MLRAIADLDGHRLDKLAVKEVLGRSVHALLAHECLPCQTSLIKDSLDVALGIAELQRGVAEAEMTIAEIPTQDVSDIEDNTGVLFTGLRSNGHRHVVANRLAADGTRAPSAPCQLLAASSLACSH